MKENALLGYAARWRGVEEERRVYHKTWQHSLGGESRSLCVLVSQLLTICYRRRTYALSSTLVGIISSVTSSYLREWVFNTGLC